MTEKPTLSPEELEQVQDHNAEVMDVAINAPQRALRMEAARSLGLLSPADVDELQGVMTLRIMEHQGRVGCAIEGHQGIVQAMFFEGVDDAEEVMVAAIKAITNPFREGPV